MFTGIGVALVTLFHDDRSLDAAGTADLAARLVDDGVRAVLAGTGGTWAGQAARRTAAARDGGADAALVLSPRRVADPRPYFAEVAAAAGDLPLLAYHFPAVSAPGIPVPMLAELPVIGVKDSSGEPDRL